MSAQTRAAAIAAVFLAMLTVGCGSESPRQADDAKPGTDAASTTDTLTVSQDTGEYSSGLIGVRPPGMSTPAEQSGSSKNLQLDMPTQKSSAGK